MAESHNDTPITDASEEAACRRGVDISPNKDGGVRKEILREGSGEAGPFTGDKVFVHYVGTLLNGEQFDSSRDRGDRFSFTLGKGQVIKGWDIGVATMKRGELSLLICRSEYAYGVQGSPPKIPPNATLQFEVELLDWQGEDLSEDQDGGILRSTLVPGQGFSSPNDGANVVVHLVGKYEGKVFDERDLSFPLGEGAELDDVSIPESVETALKKFKKAEKSRLAIKSKYAYGTKGNSEKGIPPNADVEYEVTLKSFENCKESWEMELDEKIEQCEIFKTKGTNYFKGGKFKLAVKYYSKVADYLKDESGVKSEVSSSSDSENEDGEMKDKNKGDKKSEEKKTEDNEAQVEKVQSLVLASYLNLAMCYLKLDQNIEARDACNKAIERNPQSEKAYFRRGQAELNIQNFESAISNFKRVLEIDPNNKAAKNQITMTHTKIKQEKEKEKKLYAGMFQKFAERDSKLEECKPKPEANGDAKVSSGAGDGQEAEEIKGETAST